MSCSNFSGGPAPRMRTVLAFPGSVPASWAQGNLHSWFPKTSPDLHCIGTASISIIPWYPTAQDTRTGILLLEHAERQHDATLPRPRPTQMARPPPARIASGRGRAHFASLHSPPAAFCGRARCSSTYTRRAASSRGHPTKSKFCARSHSRYLRTGCTTLSVSQGRAHGWVSRKVCGPGIPSRNRSLLLRLRGCNKNIKARERKSPAGAVRRGRPAL